MPQTDKPTGSSQSINQHYIRTFESFIHHIIQHAFSQPNRADESHIQASFNQGQRAGGVKSVEEFERASALLTEREAVSRRFNYDSVSQ